MWNAEPWESLSLLLLWGKTDSCSWSVSRAPVVCSTAVVRRGSCRQAFGPLQSPWLALGLCSIDGFLLKDNHCGAARAGLYLPECSHQNLQWPWVLPPLPLHLYCRKELSAPKSPSGTAQMHHSFAGCLAEPHSPQPSSTAARLKPFSL